MRLDMKAVMDRLAEGQLDTDALAGMKEALDEGEPDAIDDEDKESLVVDLINLRFNSTTDVLLRTATHYISKPKETIEANVKDLKRAVSILKFVIRQFQGIIEIEERNKESEE